MVEEDTIPGTYAVVELALGATDAFERTEAFEMCLPDVGDQAIVGLGDSTQLSDVTRLARSHLDEG